MSETRPIDDKRETHTCCTCGHVWYDRIHGGHSCTQLMSKKILELEAEVDRLQDLNCQYREQIQKGRDVTRMI